jgi:hypothetical protein
MGVITEQTIAKYTNEDLSILQNLLKDVTKYDVPPIISAVRRIASGVACHNYVVYSNFLSVSVMEFYKEYSPYGEGTYFSFLSDNNTLHFQFSRRNLKKIIEADISEMPLLLNTFFVGHFANWRLRIGK